MTKYEIMFILSTQITDEEKKAEKASKTIIPKIWANTKFHPFLYTFLLVYHFARKIAKIVSHYS
mgnify:CR=1 FL=1